MIFWSMKGGGKRPRLWHAAYHIQLNTEWRADNFNNKYLFLFVVIKIDNSDALSGHHFQISKTFFF